MLRILVINLANDASFGRSTPCKPSFTCVVSRPLPRLRRLECSRHVWRDPATCSPSLLTRRSTACTHAASSFWPPRTGASYVVDYTKGGDARRDGQGEAAAERGEGDPVRHEPWRLRWLAVEAAPLEQPAQHPRVLQPARPRQDQHCRRRATAGRSRTILHCY